MSAAQAAFTGIGAGDEAVKESGKHGFYTSLGIFSILATVHIARVMRPDRLRAAAQQAVYRTGRACGRVDFDGALAAHA